MSDTRHQMQKWVRQVLAENDWSAEEWGRRARTSPTNITRLLKPGTSVPSSATVAKLAAACGSAPEFVTIPVPDVQVPIFGKEALGRFLDVSKGQQAALVAKAKEEGPLVRTIRAHSDRAIGVEIT